MIMSIKSLRWVNRYRVERAAIPAMSRHAPKAEESSRDMLLRVDGDALDAISSQQLVERWHGGGTPAVRCRCRTLENVHHRC
jgi:hypothetical protein